MKPRLGIIDFRPVEYHTLVYRQLTSRRKIDVDVLFVDFELNRRITGRQFAGQNEYDRTLLSGYKYSSLSSRRGVMSMLLHTPSLSNWIRAHDAVVIHGYSDPVMLGASILCHGLRVPYFMRGDSQPRGQAAGVRRHIRNLVASFVISSSHGCLSIGQLNEAFYTGHGARRIIFSPYVVNDKRFGSAPGFDRGELLKEWGLQNDLPVIIFCGTLAPRKRPLDLASSLRLLPQEVNAIFVGDGVLADQVKEHLPSGRGVVTGSVRQCDVHSYYQAADILVLPSEFEPWGLVVNEAMTAGVLPVVSDRVGAGPDLVQDVGEIYPCGDIPALAAALHRALVKIQDPHSQIHIRERIQRFSLDKAVQGFEDTVLRH